MGFLMVLLVCVLVLVVILLVITQPVDIGADVNTVLGIDTDTVVVVVSMAGMYPLYTPMQVLQIV